MLKLEVELAPIHGDGDHAQTGGAIVAIRGRDLEQLLQLTGVVAQLAPANRRRMGLSGLGEILRGPFLPTQTLRQPGGLSPVLALGIGLHGRFQLSRTLQVLPDLKCSLGLDRSRRGLVVAHQGDPTGGIGLQARGIGEVPAFLQKMNRPSAIADGKKQLHRMAHLPGLGKADGGLGRDLALPNRLRLDESSKGAMCSK